jgi:NAD(P)-dependent dehydrogenase (short-subunit alcohol dehydrogenase family)
MSPRSWLITGASGGIGRALAELVLDRGDRAALCARDVSGLAGLVAAHPERAMPVTVDLTDAVAVDVALGDAVARLGGVDVLVNNAGVGSFGAVEELADAELLAVLAVNVFGPLRALRAVLPGMRARRAGHIIQVSSVRGLAADAGFGAYAAAKFALEGLSEALAAEVGPLGIAVSVIEPGALRTRWAGRAAWSAATIADYAGTVGALRSFLAAHDGAQPTDPREVAVHIAALGAAAPTPGLTRHILGSDAVVRVRAKLAALAAAVSAADGDHRSRRNDVGD